MTVRDFLGFPSLQEVECSGRNLKAEVNLLSLTLFKKTDGSVLATLNTFIKNCKTFSEYSSCGLNTGDTKQSLVKTLIADLDQGGRVLLGCNATSFLENGHPRVHTWSIAVYRQRKWSLERTALHIVPIVIWF